LPLLQNNQPTLIQQLYPTTSANMDPVISFALRAQGNRSLEDHIQDFLDIVQYSDFPDCALMDLFSHGLNEPIRTMLIVSGPRGSLIEFLDFALLLTGSSFTVGSVEESVDRTQVTADLSEPRHLTTDFHKPHIMPDSPEQLHKMAATPEPRHKMAATPEPLQKMAATPLIPEPAYIRSAAPEPDHAISVKPQPPYVTTPAKPVLVNATSAKPAPANATSAKPQPVHVMSSAP
ncbi:hypothetical protein M9458_025955, partial [Cirrhinus mrigala]